MTLIELSEKGGSLIHQWFLQTNPASKSAMMFESLQTFRDIYNDDMLHIMYNKSIYAYVRTGCSRYLGCIISLRARCRFKFHGSASVASVSSAKTIFWLFLIRPNEARDPMICSSRHLEFRHVWRSWSQLSCHGRQIILSPHEIHPIDSRVMTRVNNRRGSICFMKIQLKFL